MRSPTTSTAPAREREVIALGPLAAIASWASVVVVLNLTSHPLVAMGAFGGVALLAVRRGMYRLFVLSLIVGLSMVLVVPGVQLLDGSFSFAYAAGTWQRPAGVGDLLLAMGSLLRIPAQVLAACLLALVPAERLLAAAARLNPRAALLGGLAARAQPLLARDLRLVRDDLASRGLRIGRSAPAAERIRAVAAIWEAMLSGLLDRAFTTAAALETRGYGRARPTTQPLRHPMLATRAHAVPAVDVGMTLTAVCAVIFAVTLRSLGALSGAGYQVIGGLGEPITLSVVALALVTAGLGVVPAIVRPPAAVQSGATDDRPASQPSPLPPDARIVLVVDGVTMRYPGAAVSAMSVDRLELRAGELVVVAGLSGSGKSTLLDVISGVAPRATGGERRGVVRLGDRVASQGAAGHAVAAVFQDPETQVLVGNVAEEVAFGLRHAGLPIAQIEQRTLAALDQLGVAHLAHRDSASLSGGELQRVLLAAAIALEPTVLVLDEPTSQIDAASERRFWDGVDRIRRERGVAVVAAEHRLDHVLTRCTRVLVFAAGRLIAESDPARLGHVAPRLLADPYAGLVPNPAAVAVPARLTLAIERIEVGDHRSRTHTLVRHLHVEIPPRGIVTLEGANGTGKSTLLRAIRGLHPVNGTVQVDAVERGEVGESTRRIAYLAQHAGALVSGRTVAAAASEACIRLGLDPAWAFSAIEAAGLHEHVDRHPSELSVGERQRLVLVAATAHRPPVWLLDEPTRGMDANARRWVACHVLAHAASGGVVVVATHDAALAAAVATHRLQLDARSGPSLVAVRRDLAGRPLSVTSLSDTSRDEGGVRA